jgi:hypothetical protein
MTGGEKETGELDALLADIQRTIRENTRFISNLKAEAVDSDESGDDDVVDDGDYEEL